MTAPAVVTTRNQPIDAIRALALFGVMFMNILSMTMIVDARHVIASAGPIDLIVGTVEHVLMNGKARSCFAFLFGLGFGMVLARAEEAGRDGVRLHLRRMAVLLLFGLINVTFLFWGDILIHYAVIGALLPLFRHWRNGRLVGAGALLIVAPPILSAAFILLTGQPLPNFAGTGPAETARQAAAGLQAFTSPHFFDVIAHNLRFQPWSYATATVHRIEYNLALLGLFLLGLAAARVRLLTDVDRHRALLRKVACWGLPIGFAASVVNVLAPLGLVPRGRLDAVAVATFAGLPVMALGMVAALSLWFARGAPRVQALLAPAGRMSLTNYLLSGGIGTWAFYGYGLGLLGRLNIAAMSLFAFALCAALTAFSRVWLSVFYLGPAEWAWRFLSRDKGDKPPLRRKGARLRPEAVATLSFVVTALVLAGAGFIGPNRSAGRAVELRAGTHLI